MKRKILRPISFVDKFIQDNVCQILFKKLVNFRRRYILPKQFWCVFMGHNIYIVNQKKGGSIHL